MFFRKPRSRRRSGRRSNKRFGTPFSIATVAAFALALLGFNNSDWQKYVPPEVMQPLQELMQKLPQQLPQLPQSSGPLPDVSQGHVQTQFKECPQFFPQQRPPVVPAAMRLRELCYSGFAILHNGNTKTPVFVAERLNRASLERASGVARTDRFFADARLPSAERAELADYRGSGYSRGHMAPAANMASPEAMAQSFSLANMVPQNQTHNAGAWARVEDDTRHYVRRAAGDVYVFTGPLYGVRPQTIGKGKVAVPKQVFKVVYDSSNGRAWAHIQDNSARAKAGPPLSYEEFVQRTGLHLLPEIPTRAP